MFQKSAAGKKYPSNQTRGMNPYSLDIGPSSMPPPLLQADPSQLPAARNCMNSAELAELARVLRGGSSGLINLPIQPQLNYPVGGGCFTISGLNLNLGGTPTQPVFRPTSLPQPMQMNQQDHLLTSPMMPGGSLPADQSGYAPEISNGNGQSSRFMNMVDHCVDLDNYWPPY